MELFYREFGQGSPVLILHGLFGFSDNWQTIAKGLSENHLVITPDLRNHGRSPRSEEFNLEVMAEDLKEFLEEHQLHDAVLIGHSMGGKVAMQFAMNYPTAFDKLIVVDIAPRFYPVHHSQILQGLSAIPLATLASRQEADDILADYESDPAVRQFLLKNLYRNTDLGHFDWRINLPVIQKHIAEVGSELANRKIIHRPTLFIRGSESPYILSEDEKVIHQLFSDVAIVTIQGAGHWVQADRPNEFVASVLQFV